MLVPDVSLTTVQRDTDGTCQARENKENRRRAIYQIYMELG